MIRKEILIMGFNPDARGTGAHSAAVPAKNGFESAMVSVGSLVTYLAVYAAKQSYSAIRYGFGKLKSNARPLLAEIKRNILHGLRKTGIGAVRCVDNFSGFNRRFVDRMAEVGVGRAVVLQASDMVSAIKSSGKFAATVVNHVVPVLGITVLVMAVSEKASADYGVTVEFNGQEIGVVYEDSVIDEAQKVIADRTNYYDTESETYITATLSLKPLSAYDNVIDEQTLAAAFQEQIETQAPSEEAASEPGAVDPDPEITLNVYDYPESSSREKVRAFAVTVNGEFIGAVEGTDEIAAYLDAVRAEYMDGEIVDVSFDKDIEYAYEEYVLPEQIVDQDEIIDLFDSIVSEPVYYEIQQGDNPWNIASENDMTVEELQNCFITYGGEVIDDITEYCPVGATVQLSAEVPYLGIMTTKEVVYTQEIDYETVTIEDPDMYKGDSVVDIAGVEGEKEVRAYVTYKNDVAVSREILEETVISEPVTKYIRVGTRETRTPVSSGSGGSGEYFWPVSGGYISAYQGDRRGHKGIDIAAPYGTPIYAAESGTVIEATSGNGWNGGYGNCIRIEHADGNVTLYGHQSSIAVEYGDYVVKGQLIGYVGSTGDSSGNHLHFEVRSNGKYLNPIDYVSQY